MDDNGQRKLQSARRYRERNREKTRQAAQRWRDKNPEKVRAYNKKYYEEHSTVEKTRSTNWRKNNPEKYKVIQQRTHEKNREKARIRNRRWYLRTKYGITLEEYEELLEAQNHQCAICEDTLGKRPHIDHCHSKGHIRGILCHYCNTSLGFIEAHRTNIERYLNQ